MGHCGHVPTAIMKLLAYTSQLMKKLMLDTGGIKVIFLLSIG